MAKTDKARKVQALVRTPREMANAEAEAAGLKPPGQGTAKAIAEAQARLAQRPTRAAILQDATDPHVLATGPTHSDVGGWTDHMTDTFGTSSRVFVEQFMIRLANSKGRAVATQGEMNAALALMGGIAPRDELEAAIGEQIIATHFASMDFLQRARANVGEYRDSAAAYANMANKTSRTMAAHVDALARLRSGGKQQVEVRHVYIDARGSQNVIGDVHRGGGAIGNDHQPCDPAHLASPPFAPGLPLRSEDARGHAVHGSGLEGAETVPSARGLEPRRSNRRAQRALSNGAADQGDDRGAQDGPGAREDGEGRSR
jgi:hypothetical protein